MKTPGSNPLKTGALIEKSSGIGTVTRKMIRTRAVELAVIDGRTAQEMSKADLEQARRELTGGGEADPKAALLEAAPESERLDPLPGSTGQKVPVPAGEDEDEEGRSDQERLVEEGVAEAEHDQMREASKDAADRDA